MKELIPKDNLGVFADMKEIARTDSLYVAEKFSKRHDTVLRDIRQLDCSDEFRLHNFVESSYKNKQGKKQPLVFMTRDGFTYLVMGYNGKKAAQFKEAYIKAFNAMEEHLKTLAEARRECPMLTEQIKRLHGDDLKPYHISNELDMINRIATGMSAKQFREANGIDKNVPIRAHMTPEQLDLIEKLQIVDCGLILAEPDYHIRKDILIEWAAKQ